jgi:mono/diheme cytochrome c family protein
VSRRSLELIAAARLLWAAVVHAQTPALDYVLNCQGCHRADGTGTPGSVPALAGSAGRFLAVPGGREFLVRVPGVAQSALDDAATAALLNWLLDHFSRDDLPRDFQPYTAAEIARLRHNPLTDVQAVRRDLIQAIERMR